MCLEMSSQEHIKNMRLYVGGLPYQTTEQDLIELFGQVGEVASATVITDRDSGRSKGFGFVDMSNDEEAQSAIAQLNGTTLGNRTITVNEARERQAQGGRGGYQGRERRSNNNYRSDRY
jgi:RNA recognition motif-containing protein